MVRLPEPNGSVYTLVLEPVSRYSSNMEMETTVTSGLQERMNDLTLEPVTTRTYYVGDLAYVLNPDEWWTVCALDSFYPGQSEDDFDPEGYLDPENTRLEDFRAGRPFYILKTAYGDGCYQGSDGKYYSVDSGTIGCIAVVDIVEKEKLEEALAKGLGHLHEFDDFTLSSCGYDGEDDGILYFDNLEIQTGGTDDWDEEEEEEEEV